MAQRTMDVATVDIATQITEDGVLVKVLKFGVGSDVSGKFKVSAYAGVEPVNDLVMFLQCANSEQFDVVGLGQLLSELLKTVRVVVKEQALGLEKDFYSAVEGE